MSPAFPGDFFYVDNPCKKIFYKVFVLTIFSYLCLPKKKGALLWPYFKGKFF